MDSGNDYMNGEAESVAGDGWKVSVVTANSIVDKAQGEVDDFEGQETKLNTAFNEAATACDHLEIGEALDGLLGEFLGKLLESGKNAGYSICGNTKASIGAYADAHWEMAADAEAEIYSIPAPPKTKASA
ncbi:MAG: DUF6507 family protein [Arthrobacter sp.]|uniref:DUF6507 family protein n=1 Tax=Arthrobacter TaxID=1663 RepID=UPI00264BBBDA|nr:DUF6507 family protein [Micrococcaceae bacterium]MDN5822895.1 DUF6507 family protein [Micrococcaceae bacterium]MDN5877954.1 DUF6507 family protein [Micrococcaceae bacterium]MDN5886491.1 DUF6507 family protein [Micrococcaceae bacterium]MDN6169287.1 DUF6507 family protein [Micrococcaceae bacterium]